MIPLNVSNDTFYTMPSEYKNQTYEIKAVLRGNSTDTQIIAGIVTEEIETEYNTHEVFYKWEKKY